MPQNDGELLDMLSLREIGVAVRVVTSHEDADRRHRDQTDDVVGTSTDGHTLTDVSC